MPCFIMFKQKPTGTYLLLRVNRILSWISICPVHEFRTGWLICGRENIYTNPTLLGGALSRESPLGGSRLRPRIFHGPAAIHPSPTAKQLINCPRERTQSGMEEEKTDSGRPSHHFYLDILKRTRC
jgi:hypothetical protein